MRIFPRSTLFKRGPTREFHYPADTKLSYGSMYLSQKNMQQIVQARYNELYDRYLRSKKAGLTHKVWVHRGGPTSRQTHRSANGKVIHIDDAFAVGGEKLFLPSDPSASLTNTANCRCWVKYISRTAPPRTNPSRTDIKTELQKLAGRYNIPVRALYALISAESDWQQFDKNGQTYITPKPDSTAAGLGQVTISTAKGYQEDYYRLLKDWIYNLEVSVKIYEAGYNHPWNLNVSNLRIRAARAYGMYHDGWEPPNHPTRYKDHPRGLTGSQWEARYLSRY
jgi:hypothetical protein